MATPLRIASVNVNGIRAAYKKGMGEWLASRDIDVLAMQEARATTEIVEDLLGPEWHVLHDEASAKGRAGVAIVSRTPAIAHRIALGADDFDSAGRWLEADFEIGGSLVTVVSTYVHSGVVDTPKQVEKYKFLDAMTVRLPELIALNPRTVVMGDLNVGHRELDIKNWKGNRKNAGFLLEERAYFDRFFGAAGSVVEGVDGSHGPGLGWVDVGRQWAGEVAGPYTWWSQRGQAFDTDTGWRIDYHVAAPEIAASVSNYAIDKAEAWDKRWSDHAPVVVDYAV